MGKWNIVNGEIKLISTTCVDDEYPVSQMTIVPNREGGISSILTASVEGVLKTWYDTGTGPLIPFEGDASNPTKTVGIFSKPNNKVQAHDLPITGICVAHGIDVDAVTVSADHKISRVKIYGPSIIEPKKGGTWDGWILWLLVILGAVYFKVVVDTFCKGEGRDFECVKFFVGDVVKGRISVGAPFTKLLKSV